MKDLKWDIPKSLAQMRKDRNKVCCVSACGKPLTNMQGSGANIYCRDHQLYQPAYGGMGTNGESTYLFHRKHYCEECGYNPSEDTKWKHYKLKETDPVLFNRLCRARLDVDHINGDHEDNRPENLQTLCKFCHWDKTIINEDYKKGKSNGESQSDEVL